MALDDVETGEAILRELAKLRYLDSRFNAAITIISVAVWDAYCLCFTRWSDKRIEAPMQLRATGERLPACLPTWRTASALAELIRHPREHAGFQSAGGQPRAIHILSV